MTREEADQLQKALDSYAETKVHDPNKASLMKMMLAQRLERLIPDLDFDHINGNLLLGAAMSLLKMLVPKAVESTVPLSVPVVDGHKEVDVSTMSEEEYRRRYCIAIPADVAAEAAYHRSSRAMADAIFKKGNPFSKPSEKKTSDES